MKLALGTAQFGMTYGISNTEGQVSINEIKRILTEASQAGVLTLDTAAAYGESERALGYSMNNEEFQVVSKVPDAPEAIEVDSWMNQSIATSLKNLNLKSLYALLLHRPQDLFSAKGQKLYSALRSLKDRGLVNKIGISVYGPENVSEILSNFDFDLVQAPMNIIDRRMATSGCIERLKEAGVEVHIRSVFLQGLLLMPAAKRPSYFARWKSILLAYDNWLKEAKITPLEGCLGFLNNSSGVDKIIVGVESLKQFQDIIRAYEMNISNVPANFTSSDTGLINPSNWSL